MAVGTMKFFGGAVYHHTIWPRAMLRLAQTLQGQIMLEMVERKIRKLLEYYQKIEKPGAYYCIIDEILRREQVRPITISGVSLYVRTNTPDVLVAIRDLYDREYNQIRLSDPKTIIDAGAYIGTTSIFFATKYPGARILAVEPEAGNFTLLKQNTKHHHNIIPVNAAIWGTAGNRTIRHRFTGHWGYTIAETENRTESTGQEVKCVTIHSLMEEFGIEFVDLLKLDIEGAEKDVFENPLGWIASVGIIAAELHERICSGCERAFYLATRDFRTFERHGEKVVAYR